MIRRYNGVVQRAKFRVGLIQMACSKDPNENLAKAEWRIREAAGRGRADHLRAGAVPVAVLLPRRERRAVRPGRADPRAHQRGFTRLARGAGGGDHRLDLRAAHGGRLSQHRAGHRCRRHAARHLPQDAHPGRSAVLREVLLHARRPGLPLLRHAFRAASRRWSAGTSGIRRRRGWPRWAARRCSSIPTAIGWHPVREGASTARRSTMPGAPSSAPTPSPTGVYVAAVNRVGYEGPPEHGLEFWGGSFVADPVRRRCWPKARTIGRDPDRGVRPAPHRGRPPQLAVPARPPHRRVRADSEPGDRLNSGTPRALGFRMPAEWEPHEATWIAWPHNRDDWPGRFAPDPVGLRRDRAQAERASSACAFWSKGRALERQARAILRKVGARMDAVEFFHCPTDRVWTRDYRPAVRQESPQAKWPLTAWRFNAWAKYDDWQLRRPGAGVRLESPRHSASSCRTWCSKAAASTSTAPGLLLTTEECLLSPVQARNPGMKRARDRAQAARLSWASRQRDLAAQRHRRRRHARPRGRPGALRLARYGGAGLGGRPRRPQLRAAARERRHPARRPACAW